MSNDRSGLTSCDLLISGGIVMTLDESGRVFDPGAVAITENRIHKVGPAGDFAQFAAGRTVDSSGMVVLPGFVDCHTHLYQSLGKGLGDGLGVWPWLREFMWPLAAAMTETEARIAAELGAAQAVRGGTTAVLDHHAPNDLSTILAVAAAIEKVGLRGAVARSIRGPRTTYGAEIGVAEKLWRPLEEEMEITRECVQRLRRKRVEVWPAPANVVHVDQTTFTQSVELARELGTGWHTHCSEDPTDPDVYLRRYGIRPVEWLYEEGLLGPDATLAHAIWLDDKEIERVGETRSGVSYNPSSNAYIGCGAMPLRKLRSAGATVGLGVDGLAVAGPSMFRCMEQAVLLQRMHAVDPTVTDAEEVLELATREGARYLGIDAGILAAGKLADITVVNLQRLELQPVGKLASTLVYYAQSTDVSMTIVDGTIVFEGGRCRFVDEEELLREARQSTDDLVRRANLERFRLPHRRTV